MLSKGVLMSSSGEFAHFSGAFLTYPASVIRGQSYGRHLVFGYLKGGTKQTAHSDCYAILDFNTTYNIYELTGYNDTFDWWSYNPLYGGGFGYLGASLVFISTGAGYTSSLNTTAYGSRLVVDAYPGTGMTFSAGGTVCGNELVNRADHIGAPQGNIAYGLAYGYYDGSFSPSPTSNNYVGTLWCEPGFKTSTLNVGPLRTGLSNAAQGGAICKIGTEGTLAFVVNNNAVQDATTVHVALVNHTSLIATATFAGRSSYSGPLQISDTKALILDNHDYSYNGKLTLVYTNSPTAPTSLSVGGNVFVPNIAEIDPSHIDYKTWGYGAYASNAFFKTDAAPWLALYKILPQYASLYGFPSNYVDAYIYVPYKITASGTTLSAARLTTAVNGETPPLILIRDSATGNTISNYSMGFLSAPGDKAVLYYSYGSSGGFKQYCFQL